MGVRARWVVLGSVVVLAVGLGWIAVNPVTDGTGESTSPQTHVARSQCPDEMTTRETGITVPEGGERADPGHLVPEGSPVAVTVCRYATDGPSGSEPLPLTGQKELSGDLDRVVEQLREVPLRTKEGQASCMMRSPRTPYLLVVDYGKASAWVAAEHTTECDYASRYTTNGAEVFERIGQELHEGYADGRWPAG